MKSILMAITICSLLGAMALAQGGFVVGPMPTGGQKKEVSPKPDLKALMWKLSEDRTWWQTKNKLVKLCLEGHESEIMRLSGEFWRAHEQDHVVRRRSLMIGGALNRIRTEREIRDVIQRESKQMRAAIVELNAALDSKSPPPAHKLRALSGKVDSSLRRLKQYMKEDEAYRKMKTLRIDTREMTIEEADDKEGAQGRSPKPSGKKAAATQGMRLGGIGGRASKAKNETKKPSGKVFILGGSPKSKSKPKDTPKKSPGSKEKTDDRGDRKQGDLRRVSWVRPFKDARAASVAKERVLLVKPIMGGSNTPDPFGVPCGGVNDCEGSW